MATPPRGITLDPNTRLSRGNTITPNDLKPGKSYLIKVRDESPTDDIYNARFVFENRDNGLLNFKQHGTNITFSITPGSVGSTSEDYRIYRWIDPERLGFGKHSKRRKKRHSKSRKKSHSKKRKYH